MGVLARLFSKPGYYELVGGPQVGKTVAACLLAKSKQVCGSSIFITTSEEYTQLAYDAVGLEQIVVLDGLTVADFFKIVEVTEPGIFLVLDSLATLQPDHPAAKQLARSINRHIVMLPPCPVLVVNQERFPAAAGGALFRASRSGVFHLVKYRDRPFLLSKLEPTSLFLVWQWGERPELRVLTPKEELWIGGVGYVERS